MNKISDQGKLFLFVCVCIYIYIYIYHLFILQKIKLILILTAAIERPKSSIIPDSAGDEYADCKAINFFRQSLAKSFSSME